MNLKPRFPNGAKSPSREGPREREDQGMTFSAMTWVSPSRNGPDSWNGPSGLILSYESVIRRIPGPRQWDCRMAFWK